MIDKLRELGYEDQGELSKIISEIPHLNQLLKFVTDVTQVPDCDFPVSVSASRQILGFSEDMPQPDYSDIIAK